eukprot:TRINITY_DN1825_c0_g2_i3.p1 TRINITY_DN1825_c0_g2~~TRINITY_DN1825_c0_g2_i3.p1  ORF type:complete len:599 (+),score=154.37 TRINITY_DN1825_c0_g2_i3:199-1797(+)
MADAQVSQASGGGERYSSEAKKKSVRIGNIIAAKGVADAVRTSLGPRGMDKMIQNGRGEVIITNDGATILNTIEVLHPAAKMLVDLSKAQDIEAGDGTTSVVVLAGSLLNAVMHLLEKGIHPTTISDSFQAAAKRTEEILETLSTAVDLNDRQQLITNAVTSLSSKVVSQYSNLIAPIAVDSILKVIDADTASNVDLRDIRVTEKLGGTIDDTELVEGLVFARKVSHTAGGPSRIQNAKIGLIQFCLSAPKTDMENTVVVSDYTQMDRILREERQYILQMCKKIQKSGCNVLLIQKSVLRDATSDLALHFLAKMKILVVRDIERSDVEFICKTIGCRPIASVDGVHPDKLGKAALVEEQSTSDGKVIRITGVENPGKTVSVLVRGSNKLVLQEAGRSLHDALCVVRSLVKKRYLIPGGGAPEVEVARILEAEAKGQAGMGSYCMRAFAEALLVIPSTLAENAGLDPITIVTELRRRHAEGEKYAGINVRKGTVSDMHEENVVQPLLVSTSAINLATETVRMLLKIDDMVAVR